MNSGLKSQIYQQLNLKDTDELIEIWKTNDQTEWSEAAFESIKQILTQRNAPIPPQDVAIVSLEQKSENSENEELEEWEAKLVDSEVQPDFYDTLEVIDLNDKINLAAKAAIVIYSVLALLNLPFISALGEGISYNQFIDFLPSILYTILSYGAQILITFYSLKALGSILRILMQMEFNSRRVKQ